MRPSTCLTAYLAGELTDPPDWLLSWASFYVYRYARSVADQPTREARREALARVPVGVRGEVEIRAREIYKQRWKDDCSIVR